MSIYPKNWKARYNRILGIVESTSQKVASTLAGWESLLLGKALWSLKSPSAPHSISASTRSTGYAKLLLLGFLLLYLTECLLLPDRPFVLRADPLLATLITAAIIGAVSGTLSYISQKLALRRQTIQQGVGFTGELTTASYGEPIGWGGGDEVPFGVKWIYRSYKPYVSNETTGGGKGKPRTSTARTFIDCGAIVCDNPGGLGIAGVRAVLMDEKKVYPPTIYGSNTVSLYFNGVNQALYGTVIGTDENGDLIWEYNDASGILPSETSLNSTEGVNRILLRIPSYSNNQSAPFSPRGIGELANAEAIEIRLGGQEQIDQPIGAHGGPDTPIHWYVNNPGADSYQAQGSSTGANTAFWINYGVGGLGNTGIGAKPAPWALAPSYTNRLSIWFKGLEISEWGNRLPQIKVVVQFTDGTLKEIVIKACKLAGLTDDDLNVDVLDDIDTTGFYGVAVGDITEPKDVLDMLGAAFSFALPEVDGTLKAVLLGGDGGAIPTIPASDVGVEESGIEERRGGSGERTPKYSANIANQNERVPKSIVIRFIDKFKNYNQNATPADRRVSASKATMSLTWPLVMTTALASRIGKTLAYTTWAERITYKLSLLPKYVKYHPGDIVNITTAEGYNTDIRFTNMSIAAGGMIEANAVRVLPETYSQVGTVIPLTWQPAEIHPSQFPDSTVWIADVPAVTDEHDNEPGWYVAADRVHPISGIVSQTDNTRPDFWTGTEIYLNRAGTDEATPHYEVIQRLNSSANISMMALDADASADSLYVLTPADQTWQSLSTTEWDSARFLSNVIIVGTEIIQFKNVETWSGRTQKQLRKGDFLGWRLYTLRRARRGTKPQNHREYEPVVLYDPQHVKFVPLSQINAGTYNLRGATIGQYPQAADVVQFVYNPEANKHSWAVSYQVRNVNPASNDAVTVTDSIEVVLA